MLGSLGLFFAGLGVFFMGGGTIYWVSVQDREAQRRARSGSYHTS